MHRTNKLMASSTNESDESHIHYMPRELKKFFNEGFPIDAALKPVPLNNAINGSIAVLKNQNDIKNAVLDLNISVNDDIFHRSSIQSDDDYYNSYGRSVVEEADEPAQVVSRSIHSSNSFSTGDNSLLADDMDDPLVFVKMVTSMQTSSTPIADIFPAAEDLPCSPGDQIAVNLHIESIDKNDGGSLRMRRYSTSKDYSDLVDVLTKDALFCPSCNGTTSQEDLDDFCKCSICRQAELHQEYLNTLGSRAVTGDVRVASESLPETSESKPGAAEVVVPSKDRGVRKRVQSVSLAPSKDSLRYPPIETDEDLDVVYPYPGTEGDLSYEIKHVRAKLEAALENFVDTKILIGKILKDFDRLQELDALKSRIEKLEESARTLASMEAQSPPLSSKPAANTSKSARTTAVKKGSPRRSKAVD